MTVNYTGIQSFYSISFTYLHIFNYSFEIKDFSEKKLNPKEDHIVTAAGQRQTALFYYYKRIR